MPPDHRDPTTPAPPRIPTGFRNKARACLAQRGYPGDTFQEEYREFLRRHQVEYDERYVWD